jgi:D-amino-acid dehydrogenase
MTPAQAIEIEPALAPIADRIVGADYCAEDESGDAHAFTVRRAQRCRERGVEFRFDTTVASLRVEDGRTRGVELTGPSGARIEEGADAVIVCLGVSAARLLAPV